MNTTKTPMNRRGTPLRKLTSCASLMALAMACGCSSADKSEMPSIGNGGLQGSANPPGESAANKVIPASTPIFDDEATMNVVAQVGLEGRVIKFFFEPEEGTLLEVERAVAGMTPDPNEKGLSGSALYTYLTKKEAPAALVDAERRVAELAARDGSDVLKDANDVTAVADAFTSETSPAETSGGGLPGIRTLAEWDEGPYSAVPATESYFLNKYCTPTDRFWSCGGTPDLICVGDSWIQKSGVNMMQAGAWSGDGTHSMYVRYGIEYRRTTLYPGYVSGWRRTSGTNRDPRSEVDYGGSGWYRHCVNYHF